MPVKTINFELQQKWLNFINPTEIEHYGYCFTESQMRQFPEGRVVLCGIKKAKHRVRLMDKEVALYAKQFNETLDGLVLQALNVS